MTEHAFHYHLLASPSHYLENEPAVCAFHPHPDYVTAALLGCTNSMIKTQEAIVWLLDRSKGVRQAAGGTGDYTDIRASQYIRDTFSQVSRMHLYKHEPISQLYIR
jgi:hypothetical protein